MVKLVATAVGCALLLVGVLGFATPGLLGMHLMPLHNVVHLVSGALALYFGLRASSEAARTFCVAFGAIYGALGLLGFLLDGPDKMWRVIPGQLEFGVPDHIVHVILGGAFLLVALAAKSSTPTGAHPHSGPA